MRQRRTLVTRLIQSLNLNHNVLKQRFGYQFLFSSLTLLLCLPKTNHDHSYILESWVFLFLLTFSIIFLLVISFQKQSSKVVLKNFAKFKRKHLCQSLFFNKVEGLSRHRCFPVNFAKFLRTPFFVEHLWWLILSFHNFFNYFEHVRNFLDIFSLSVEAFPYCYQLLVSLIIYSFFYNFYFFF